MKLVMRKKIQMKLLMGTKAMNLPHEYTGFCPRVFMLFMIFLLIAGQIHWEEERKTSKQMLNVVSTLSQGNLFLVVLKRHLSYLCQLFYKKDKGSQEKGTKLCTIRPRLLPDFARNRIFSRGGRYFIRCVQKILNSISPELDAVEMPICGSENACTVNVHLEG